MCGICGVIDWSGAGEATALVRRMTPTMLHRGPDDEGYFDALLRSRISKFEIRNSELENYHGSKKDGSGGSLSRDTSLSIGMRRLSIIDLEGGHQPIFNEDGSVAVVLNGEIYNFQELRSQLQDRGHTFRTRADSEVVAHAYEEWGADCVDFLQGMFAFAVWDGRRDKGQEYAGTLFLARDRLGIKPLYYYQGIAEEFRVPSSEFRVQKEKRHHGDTENTERIKGINVSELETQNSKLEISGCFLFASEVRTLLASGAVPRRLSQSALESYLLFGSVSEPVTLVEGVFSLPPGHRMTLNLARPSKAVSEPYWNIAETRRGDGANGGRGDRETGGRREAGTRGHGDDFQRNGQPATKSDVATAARHVRELLEKSVKQHLIADVPVGVFLSSGIDSTSLAALASREAGGVHTFTVAFPEGEFSEARIARRTAERFGTTHQELMLSSDEMIERLENAIAALDQPTMDGVNTYFVSWAARQAGLKVALSGLGGDEVFGGYNTFSRTPKLKRVAAIGSRIPSTVRSAMSYAVSGAANTFALGDAVNKITALWNKPDSLPDPYFFSRALFTPAQVAELMNGSINPAQNLSWWRWLSESAAQARTLDPFTAVSCMEARSYLVNTLLRDTDAMSMAHSLEVRVPFLDHLLVEFVTQLPEEIKLSKRIQKSLLVRALRDLLPEEVVQQRKRGFTFPWAAWLRGPLREKLERGLNEMTPALGQTINADGALRVWRNYLGGHTSWSRPWSLYVLNEWVKRHLE